MRGLVQRVTRAGVSVDGTEVGAIGPGLCVLVGVTHADDEAAARKLADKIWGLRVFEDDEGRMNRSLADRAGVAGEVAEVLLVSQFTLYADTRKGRRPSYVHAAREYGLSQASPPFVRQMPPLRVCTAIAGCAVAVTGSSKVTTRPIR